jgi:thiamine transport system ATP-binding protein
MLKVHDVRVSFGDVAALDGTTLEVPAGSITVVMGPSGCGKSTLLRVIAGLASPETGSVSWGDRDLSNTPTHLRGFGLMFQDYALFPHRSVEANVAFGLRMAGNEPEVIDARVAETLALVGLDGYAQRRINGLSGGEQQRVALARALAPAPQLLMLDEPIGALDRDLRTQLMVDMRQIFRRLDLTVVYVTHDQEEAFALADRIAVMRAGRVLETNTPQSLWDHPGSPFVARFMGRENVLDASTAAQLAGTGILPDVTGPLAISPQLIRISPAADGDGRVLESRFIAGAHRTRISVGGITLIASGETSYPTGSAVEVSVDAAGLVPLSDDTP